MLKYLLKKVIYSLLSGKSSHHKPYKHKGYYSSSDYKYRHNHHGHHHYRGHKHYYTSS
jgi:hypothetical protein